MKTEITHPFPPLYDSRASVLILGSFPSVKSREQHFFYGHPQNRFWKVIAAVLDAPVPDSISEKKTLLLSRGIALWDSVGRCEIEGSSDASIGRVVPNDLSPIFENAQIAQVFCNGRKSFELYGKYIEPQSGRAAICLPSTSPANAAWKLDMLIGEWSAALSPYLRQFTEKDEKST